MAEHDLTLMINALVGSEDFAQAKADVIARPGGDHIASVTFDAGRGHLTIQCSDERGGAPTLIDGLRLLADKVEAAHAEWLGRKTGEGDA